MWTSVPSKTESIKRVLLKKGERKIACSFYRLDCRHVHRGNDTLKKTKKCCAVFSFGALTSLHVSCDQIKGVTCVCGWLPPFSSDRFYCCRVQTLSGGGHCHPRLNLDRVTFSKLDLCALCSLPPKVL